MKKNESIVVYNVNFESGSIPRLTNATCARAMFCVSYSLLAHTREISSSKKPLMGKPEGLRSLLGRLLSVTFSVVCDSLL
jgi:hypothetical protein